MFSECRNLSDILEAQKDIIERHVDQHRWFQGIPNKEEAVRDFVEKYGFIMREFYCCRICVDRFDCRLAQKYKPR